MREKRFFAYSFFILLGIVSLLIAFIAKSQKFDLTGDIAKDLGIIFISIALINWLWKIAGGNPLSDQISTLKTLNAIYQDAQNSGITNIYVKASEIESYTWMKLINSSKKQIDLASHTLYQISDQLDILEALKERLVNGVKIRILINSPENPALKALALSIDEDLKNIEIMRHQMRYSWNKFDTLKKTLDKSFQDNITIVRLNEGILHAAFRRFDDQIFIVPYLYSKATPETPVYVIKDESKPLFKAYLAEFEELFEYNRKTLIHEV